MSVTRARAGGAVRVGGRGLDPHAVDVGRRSRRDSPRRARPSLDQRVNHRPGLIALWRGVSRKSRCAVRDRSPGPTIRTPPDLAVGPFRAPDDFPARDSRRRSPLRRPCRAQATHPGTVRRPLDAGRVALRHELLLVREPHGTEVSRVSRSGQLVALGDGDLDQRLEVTQASIGARLVKRAHSGDPPVTSAGPRTPWAGRRREKPSGSPHPCPRPAPSR